MAQKKRTYTLGHLADDLVKAAGAALTIVILVAIVMVLSGAVLTIVHTIWPVGRFTVDKNVVELVRTFSWPLAICIIVFLISASRPLQNGARSIFNRVSKLKLGNYEVNFSEEGAKRLKRDFEDTIRDFENQSNVEFSRSARTHRAKESLKVLTEEILRLSRDLSLPDRAGIQVRHIEATAHVPDVVYNDSLYQLVDYYPTGKGHGRRFSTRYGAIGIAWRSEKTQCWNTTSSEHSPARLISHYGMTSEEAAYARSIECAIAMPIRNSKGEVSGVYFFRAKEIKNVSSKATDQLQLKDLQILIEKSENDNQVSSAISALGDALTKVYEDVSPSGPFLSIFD